MKREDLDVKSGLGVLHLATAKGYNYFLVQGKHTRFRIYRVTKLDQNAVTDITSVAHDRASLVALAGKLVAGNEREQELVQTIRTLIAKMEAEERTRLKNARIALRLAAWNAAPRVYYTRARGKRLGDKATQ